MDDLPPDPRSNPEAFASRLASRLRATRLPTLPADRGTVATLDGDLNHLHASFDVRAIDWRVPTAGGRIRRTIVGSVAHSLLPLQEHLTSLHAASARLHASHLTAIRALEERVAELGRPREAADRGATSSDAYNLAAAEPEAASAALAVVAEAFDAPGHVLDIRCGSGAALAALAARGVSASGVDPRWDLVGAARAQGLDAVTGDWQRLLAAVPDASLGGIVAVQALEWGARADGVHLIREAFRALRPGGVLAIEIIDPAVLIEARGVLLPDLREVSPNAVALLARHVGFELERHDAPDDPALETLRACEGAYVTGPVHLLVARRPGG